MTEDVIVDWHQQLNGHEFEQALGVGDGQGSLACRSPSGHKELNTTENIQEVLYKGKMYLVGKYQRMSILSELIYNFNTSPIRKILTVRFLT